MPSYTILDPQYYIISFIQSFRNTALQYNTWSSPCVPTTKNIDETMEFPRFDRKDIQVVARRWEFNKSKNIRQINTPQDSVLDSTKSETVIESLMKQNRVESHSTSAINRRLFGQTTTKQSFQLS